MSITELPSMEAEYLAPTTDTGLIPLVSPDRRFTKLRDASGQVAAHLVKIPLDPAGMPAYQRALPAHGGRPVSAYLHVANDDRLQFPRFAYVTFREQLAAFAAAATGLVALVAAWFGAWTVAQ
jgi:hypothetical protein